MRVATYGTPPHQSGATTATGHLKVHDLSRRCGKRVVGHFSEGAAYSTAHILAPKVIGHFREGAAYSTAGAAMATACGCAVAATDGCARGTEWTIGWATAWATTVWPYAP